MRLRAGRRPSPARGPTFPRVPALPAGTRPTRWALLLPARRRYHHLQHRVRRGALRQRGRHGVSDRHGQPEPQRQRSARRPNLLHEPRIAEYLTDPNGSSGWRCSIGTSDTEIADLCSGGWGGGPWAGNTSGQPYDVTISGNHYALTDLWQPGLVNGCYAQPPDLTRIGTFPSPSCTLGSGYALQTLPTGWCTTPTCSDGQRDGWETDVDCGGACPNYRVSGPLSPPSSGLCASGKHCQYSTDCVSGTCTGGGTCL